jgi:hypothetical protein
MKWNNKNLGNHPYKYKLYDVLWKILIKMSKDINYKLSKGKEEDDIKNFKGVLNKQDFEDVFDELYKNASNNDEITGTFSKKDVDKLKNIVNQL